MEKEKKYSGYGYHGGGRPKETPSKQINVRFKLPDYELIKSEAQKAGKSMSNLIVSAALEKIKK